MTQSPELKNYLARARKLKALANKLDVKENVWCQRGCDAERITLMAAIPAVRRDLCMLVFKTVTMGPASVESWFLATFYLSKKAMGWTRDDGDSCPLGWYCALESAGGRVFGVMVTEDSSLSHAELVAKLDAKGMATWAMEKLGIEVPLAPVIHLADARKSRAAATA